MKNIVLEKSWKCGGLTSGRPLSKKMRHISGCGYKAEEFQNTLN